MHHFCSEIFSEIYDKKEINFTGQAMYVELILECVLVTTVAVKKK